MRGFALAAATAGFTMLLAGAALARPWTDPAGRLTFDAPAGWTTTQEAGTEPNANYTYVISGTANNECQFFSFVNPTTASMSADLIRRQSGESERFTREMWTRTLNGIGVVFPNDSAQVLSTSSETDRYWPIQRAEAQSPDRPVHAALHLRPGVDIVVLCMTYAGADPTAVYDQVIRSVAHPNDAAFGAAADAQAAARTEQAQQQQEQQRAAEEAQTERNAAREEDQRRQRGGRFR